MPYTATTWGSLKASLASRLHDPASVFWNNAGTTDELGRYLREALRTFGALTRFYRDRQVFNTTGSQAFYDLQTVLPALTPTVSDRDLIGDLEVALMEPVSDTSWAGTEQFTLDDLTNAIARRRDQFLLETGQIVTIRTGLNGPAPRVNRWPLPETVISVRRVQWTNVTTLVATALMRDDTWGLTGYGGSWAQVSPDDPIAYAVDVVKPVTLLLAARPINQATIDLLTVDAGATLDPTVGVIVGVPDDWVWLIKWGALADLFGMAGVSQDPDRASFCEQFWQQGLEWAKAASRVLQVYLDEVAIQMTSPDEADRYLPSWMNTTAEPTLALTAGMNVVGFAPIPDDAYGIAIEYVAPAPMPVDDDSLIQVPDDALDALLDYAQHLAAVKQGGAVLISSQVLRDRFFRFCGVDVNKWTAEVPDAPMETGATAQNEAQLARVTPA